VGVSKRYGATQALLNAEIEVKQGEIHALVGRNGAGKSTLVSLLTGMTAPDSGTVRLQGAEAPAPSDRDAWRSRVACVYQKPMVVPDLTVAENILLGRMPKGRSGAISWRSARQQAQEALDEWNSGVSVDWDASRLTVEQRKVVEVVRALLLGSSFVILDEPTAGMEAREVSRLFEHIRRLRTSGVAFLYISHHLEEVFELCDTATVFRDGQWVETQPTSALTPGSLVSAMVGQAGHGTTSLNQRHAALSTSEDPAIRVEGISLAGWFHDVSFEVRPGECVAVAGLAGSGKLQVAEVIAGKTQPDAGTVQLGAENLSLGRVDRMIRHGFGYVPGDRYKEGFVVGMSVGENMTMSIPTKLGRWGWIRTSRRDRIAKDFVRRLDIKASSIHQEMSELSGGNQQKATLGRALASDPQVLVLAYPTAGVDIASKETLFRTIHEARESGLAVIVVSDEIDELRVADRVVVLFKGLVVREMEHGWDERTMVATMEGLLDDDH
jgi:simple sugar transport system ATP-binding protein